MERRIPVVAFIILHKWLDIATFSCIPPFLHPLLVTGKKSNWEPAFREVSHFSGTTVSRLVRKSVISGYRGGAEFHYGNTHAK